MERRTDKIWNRERSKYRIRKRLAGAPSKPRLVVFRSLKNIYVQAVDDETGRTLAAASSLEKGLRGSGVSGGSLPGAKAVGAEIARRLTSKGLAEVVFDRGGYRYHGRIRVLAESARENGLKF